MVSKNTKVECLNQVYLKFLKEQELGWRGGEENKAGRYIYISSDTDVLSIFPPLSKTILNDFIYLKVRYLNTSKTVYVKFIYHNDKWVTNNPKGRDEYRIYLNNELEDGLRLQPGYILSIFKLNANEFAFHILAPDDPDFVKMKNLVPVKGHLLAPMDSLPTFESYITLENIGETKVIIPKEVAEESLTPEFNKLVNEDIAVPDEPLNRSLIRNANFRDLVVFFYHEKCAITGKQISYESLLNVEAAHIKPKAHNGPNVPSNGLALCRDFHWAFDKGFFTITNDFKVYVHTKMRDSRLLMEFDGKEIFLPEDSRARPSREFLEHHQKNVFGLFLRAGGIRQGF